MRQQNQSNEQEVDTLPLQTNIKHRNLISKQQEEHWNNSKSTREKSVWPVQMKTKQAEKTHVTTQLWFIGLVFKNNLEVINVNLHLKKFQDQLIFLAGNFYKDDMKIEAHIVRKSDLTKHITDIDIQKIVHELYKAICWALNPRY